MMRRMVTVGIAALLAGGCGGAAPPEEPKEQPPTETPAEQVVPDEVSHVAIAFVEAVRTSAPDRGVSAWRTAVKWSSGPIRKQLREVGPPPASARAIQRRARTGASADVVAVQLELESDTVASGQVTTRERSWDRGAIAEEPASYRIELHNTDAGWRVVSFSVDLD